MNPEQQYGREQAWVLLAGWTQSESLRKHALAVEACVVAYGEAEANRLGLAGVQRDELLRLYSTTALLHDFDYERHPTADEHPFVGVRELERLGWPLELTLEREGLRFFLVHIPPPRAPVGVHVLLHGHTHVPRDEVRGGVRWLNPGSASHPRGAPPSFGWLEVEAGKLTRWSLGRI